LVNFKALTQVVTMGMQANSIERLSSVKPHFTSSSLSCKGFKDSANFIA